MAKKVADGGAVIIEKHNMTLLFTEPEDIQLYERLKADAKSDRRDIRQYTLLKLHELFENDLPSVNT